MSKERDGGDREDGGTGWANISTATKHSRPLDAFYKHSPLDPERVQP